MFPKEIDIPHTESNNIDPDKLSITEDNEYQEEADKFNLKFHFKEALISKKFFACVFMSLCSTCKII